MKWSELIVLLVIGCVGCTITVAPIKPKPEVRCYKKKPVVKHKSQPTPTPVIIIGPPPDPRIEDILKSLKP